MKLPIVLIFLILAIAKSSSAKPPTIHHKINVVTDSVSRVMAMTEAAANRIQAVCKGTKDDKVKPIYLKCLHKYNDVLRNLKEARRFLQAGNKKSAKDHTVVAMSAARLCGEDLANNIRRVPSYVVKDNKRVQELCNIVYNSCA